jgi:hypothetical protein
MPKNNQPQKSQRNPFVALCDYASQDKWCWKLACTTCGHGAFTVSFLKIVRGQHPDEESFWPNGKDNAAPLKEMGESKDFFGGTDIEAQIKLASIVAKAKLSDIQAIAKFPDWLGYIGLVINHCPNRDAQKIISEALLPQFIAMVKNDGEIYEYLKEKQIKQELININDLSRIENKSVNLINPL